MKKKTLFALTLFIVIAVFIFHISCNKDDDSDYGLQKYSIGGAVEGLVGSGLVLQNNNSDDVSIAENGTFTFPIELEDSTEYDVTIKSFPTGQTCYVENGSGMVDGTNVTDIEVICQTPVNSGSCSDGSIEYYHEIARDIETFHEERTVSGIVPFTCDNNGNLSGTGTLLITVDGSVAAPCLISTYSGSATINVTLTGTMDIAQIFIYLDETWFVGSPIATGISTNTCNQNTQPYNYTLIEMLISETLAFPNIDGYTIKLSLDDGVSSGYYSWTLKID